MSTLCIHTLILSFYAGYAFVPFLFTENLRRGNNGIVKISFSLFSKKADTLLMAS